jgi:hypothetical protein
MNAIMKATVIAAVSALAVASTLPLAATAQAVPDSKDYYFQSPSGNIHCGMHQGVNNTRVECDIADHTWAAPPPPPSASCNPGDFAAIAMWDEPRFECSSGWDRAQPGETLNYGQTHTVGDFICESEPSGVTCTRTNTGHWFRIAQDSFELH